MKLLKPIKKFIFALSMGLANVEKNALGQQGNTLASSDDAEVQVKQNQLADDLIRGRVTEEVVMLRARMYKIIEAADKLNPQIQSIGRDMAILDADVEETEMVNIADVGSGDEDVYDISAPTKVKKCRKIKGDTFDSYKISMVINNDPITDSMLDTFERIDKFEKKRDFSIEVTRNILPKFSIEKNTKRLFIRDINDDEKLLEFYIPMYKDKYNKKIGFMLNQIKKAKVNPRSSDFLDIKGVNFLTYNDVGVDDFKSFQYGITGFDKIVEFDGYYVIKFFAKPIIENSNTLEKYGVEALDEKYNNKEAKENYPWVRKEK